MTLLVITPTLGRSPYLREAVGSVAACGGGIRHVLVCPTSEAARLVAEFPLLEVIGDDSRGVYAAINRGLEVEGPWDAWTWINDDDRWHADGMRNAIATMERDPTIDVVYGRVAFIDAAGGWMGEVPIESNPQRLVPLLSAGVAAVTQQGTLVRSVCAQRLERLDTRYRLVADLDYWTRAVVAGCRFVFVNRHVADFRIREGQLSEDSAAVRDESLRILRAHFPGGPGAAGRLAAVWFRVRRWPEIVARYRRTGCWRTRSLFSRARSQPGRNG